MLFNINKEQHIRYIVEDIFCEFIKDDYELQINEDNVSVCVDGDVYIASKEMIQIEMDNYNEVKKSMLNSNLKENKICIIANKGFFDETHKLIKVLNAQGYSVDVLYNGNFYYLNEKFDDVNITVYDVKNWTGLKGKEMKYYIRKYIERTRNTNFLVYGEESLDIINDIKGVNKLFLLYFSMFKDSKYMKKLSHSFNYINDRIITNNDQVYSYFKLKRGKCVYLNSLADNIRYTGSKRIMVLISSLDNYDFETMYKTLSPIGIPCFLFVDDRIDTTEIEEGFKRNFIKYDLIKYDNNNEEVFDIMVHLYSDFFKLIVSYDNNELSDSIDNGLNYPNISYNKLSNKKNVCVDRSNIIGLIKNIIKLYGNPFDNNIEYGEKDIKNLNTDIEVIL